MDRFAALREKMAHLLAPDAKMSEEFDTAVAAGNYATALQIYGALRLLAETSARAEIVSPGAEERGCVNKEDYIGDSLVLDRNLIVFINLEGRKPLLTCYRWSELRQLIEQPDVPERERVHLYFQEGKVSTRVYQLGNSWYDPRTEPLTRYYNTFVVRKSYNAPIGSSFGVSNIHGEVYPLRQLEPVHRYLVAEVVEGHLSKGEVASLITDEFIPLAEDLVAPTAVLGGASNLYLGDTYEGLPSGYGNLWKRSGQEVSRQFGNEAVPVVEAALPLSRVAAPVAAPALNLNDLAAAALPANGNVALAGNYYEGNIYVVHTLPLNIPPEATKVRISGIINVTIPTLPNLITLLVRDVKYLNIYAQPALRSLTIEGVLEGTQLFLTSPIYPELQLLSLRKVDSYHLQVMPQAPQLQALTLIYVLGALAPLESYPLRFLTLFASRQVALPFYPRLCYLATIDNRTSIIPDVPHGTRLISMERYSMMESLVINRNAVLECPAGIPPSLPVQPITLVTRELTYNDALDITLPAAELVPNLRRLIINYDNDSARIVALELPSYPLLEYLVISHPPENSLCLRLDLATNLPSLSFLSIKGGTIVSFPTAPVLEELALLAGTRIVGGLDIPYGDDTQVITLSQYIERQ